LLTGRFTEAFQGHLAACLVGVVLAAQVADEILEVVFSQPELSQRRRLRMGIVIPRGVVEDEVVVQQRGGDAADVLLRHLPVGRYAAAVRHAATVPGAEAALQRIRDVGDAAVLPVMGIVDGLDAAPAGGVVFGGGDLDAGVVRQAARGLYQSLAEGTLPHDHAAVQVLHGAGDDFGGRGRL